MLAAGIVSPRVAFALGGKTAFACEGPAIVYGGFSESSSPTLIILAADPKLVTQAGVRSWCAPPVLYYPSNRNVAFWVCWWRIGCQRNYASTLGGSRGYILSVGNKGEDNCECANHGCRKRINDVYHIASSLVGLRVSS